MDGVQMSTRSGQGGNEDVVHIDDDTSALLGKAELDVLEDLVHHGLECTWRICQPKEHHSWFEKTIFGLEYGFLFIPRLDPNVVIAPSYVKFGEDIRILYLTDEI